MLNDIYKLDKNILLNMTIQEWLESNNTIYIGVFSNVVKDIWDLKQNYIYDFSYNKKTKITSIAFSTLFKSSLEKDLNVFVKIFGDPINGIQWIGSSMYEYRFEINKKTKLKTLILKLEKLYKLLKG